MKVLIKASECVVISLQPTVFVLNSLQGDGYAHRTSVNSLDSVLIDWKWFLKKKFTQKMSRHENKTLWFLFYGSIFQDKNITIQLTEH